MCDYSLMMFPNRLATEGEELVAHKFRSGSVGIVSCDDFNSWAARPRKSRWQWLRDVFPTQSEPQPVVCIPPGARLRLIGMPAKLTQIPTNLYQEVVFTQVSAEASQYRDALFFSNGVTILLQQLPEGQKMKILRLSSSEVVTPDRDLPELARIA
jgi:hypothetical protein